jgi:uncharacterized protein YrrD
MADVSEEARRSAEQERRLSYWLGHSECFRVHSTEGHHVGFVEDVLWSPDESVVEALLVRVGFDARRTVTVPIRDVVEVRPRASAIVARISHLTPAC